MPQLEVIGKCHICCEISSLSRRYYHYNIKCECHFPYHFEMIEYCKKCIPFEPEYTTYIKNNKEYTVNTKSYEKID